ncbi:TIGR02300 family protein [Loktanella sp. M215]|uniref:TIGR02300 family protein n=1 Tax=Loktanella sp. M215 TaxID=2675431 RepID=UPI001F2152F9|nr:TIGR02300 family protein [Loktanella sp. M215]MCF7699353.1 TIGR02300 family protein [Loktanella sp. M215]
MPKEEWGTKRLCPETGKRFYDLNKTPVVSPYTGNVVNIETSKTRTMVADAEDAQTKKMKVADEEDDLVLDDDDDEDEDVDLGDDVLEDDDDDTVSLDDIADVSKGDDD